MSSQEVVLRQFEGNEVRFVLIDGAVWYVAKDVCQILGYADTVNAAKQHCKGVVKRHPLQTVRGIQHLRIIDRSDVLRLITHSKLPTAQRFEKWIFEEVLPSILETGSYSLPSAAPTFNLDNKEHLLVLVEATAKKVLELKGEVERLGSENTVLSDENTELKQKLELLAGSEGELSLRDGAYTIGYTKPNVCTENWVRAGILYRKKGNKRKGRLKTYQKYIDKGYFVVKVVESTPDGKSRSHLYLTIKGALWLADPKTQAAYSIPAPMRPSKQLKLAFNSRS